MDPRQEYELNVKTWIIKDSQDKPASCRICMQVVPTKDRASAI